jgi:hypothetical protein
VPTRGTTPTQIRIPGDVKAAARKRAEAMGETLSAMVVRLLRTEVGITPPPPAAEQGDQAGS